MHGFCKREHSAGIEDNRTFSEELKDSFVNE